MPKKIVMKYKEYVPDNLIDASFIEDVAKDVLGWLISIDTDIVLDCSREHLAKEIFEVSKSTLNRNLMALQEIGAIELGGARYGDHITLKLLKENI